eukprot:950430-Rhodomonas_salina.1
MDTGCSPTMLKDQSLFIQDTLKSVPGSTQVAKGDSEIVNLQEGEVKLLLRTLRKRVHTLHTKALFSSELRENLLLVSSLTDLGYKGVFKSCAPYLSCPNGDRVPMRSVRGQWYVDLLLPEDISSDGKVVTKDLNTRVKTFKTNLKTSQATAMEGCSQTEVDFEEKVPQIDQESITQAPLPYAKPEDTPFTPQVHSNVPATSAENTSDPEEQTRPASDHRHHSHTKCCWNDKCSNKKCKSLDRVRENAVYQYWHRKFGHLNEQQLISLSKTRSDMPDLSGYYHEVCHVCMTCKSKRCKLPKKAQRRATKPLER